MKSGYRVYGGIRSSMPFPPHTLGSASNRRRRPVLPHEMLQCALARVHLVQRVPVIHAPVLHHVADRVGVLDVIERILIEYDEIRELAPLDRAEIAAHADAFGTEDRRRAEHVVVRHAAGRHHPHLPLIAESLELAVATDADAAARLDHLLRELSTEGEGVLFVHEPSAGPRTATRVRARRRVFASSSASGVKRRSFASPCTFSCVYQ